MGMTWLVFVMCSSFYLLLEFFCGFWIPEDVIMVDVLCRVRSIASFWVG